MIAEMISFWIYITIYILLSLIKTVNKRSNDIQNSNNNNASRKTEENETSKVFTISSDSDLSTEKSTEIDVDKSIERAEKRLIFFKSVVNYCVSFNSAFLIVGSLSEAYLYGVRMYGNILSVFLGYVYSSTLVHPFFYSFKDEISSPYHYFQKRYREKVYMRSIVGGVAMFFYFSFLTLYLWGCTVLFSTLLPEVPFWLSSVIIGIYSMYGSSIGGFTQSTPTNAFQFFVLVFGLIAAIQITIAKNPNHSLTELWNLAVNNNRTNFIDTSVDFTTRYTIINQAVSLPMPWCSLLGILLPNYIRYKSVKKKANSRLLFLSNIPFMILVNALVLLAGGIMCFIFFFGCDPFLTFNLKNKNQIGIYWMHHTLATYMPSLSGLIFASIIYYSVVQHSIGMNLCADTIIKEIIQPLFLNVNKATIKLGLNVVLGFGSILYAISFQFVRNTMISLFFIFNNSLNSPILGIYLLSVFNPYANHVGALLAFILNLCINAWLALGALIFSRTKSQEFPLASISCESELIHNRNYTLISSYMASNSSIFNTNQPTTYYPENKFLYSMYSIAPIWYCIFSVLFNLVFGSIFSLLYSLLRTGTLDADKEFKNERRKYMYFYRFKNYF